MSRNYCLNCGNELKHNDYFCSKCGTENPHIQKDPVLKRRARIQHYENQEKEARIPLTTFKIIQLIIVVLTGLLIITVALLRYNPAMFFSVVLSFFWFSIAFSMYKGKKGTGSKQEQIGIITMSIFTFFATFITNQFDANPSFESLALTFHIVLVVMLCVNIVLAIISSFLNR